MDGSARPLPGRSLGPGGIGCLLTDSSGTKITKLSYGARRTSCVEIEYKAVLYGLRITWKFSDTIIVYSDRLELIHLLNGKRNINYETTQNIRLQELLIKIQVCIKSHYKEVVFRHISRDKNKAHRLAAKASRKMFKRIYG